VQGVATPNTMLHKDDVLVVYGHNEDIQRLLNNKLK